MGFPSRSGPPPAPVETICIRCVHLNKDSTEWRTCEWLCDKTATSVHCVTGNKVEQHFRCVDRNTGNCQFYKREATDEEVRDYLIGKRPWVEKPGRCIEWIDPLIGFVVISILALMAAYMAVIAWLGI